MLLRDLKLMNGLLVSRQEDSSSTLMTIKNDSQCKLGYEILLLEEIGATSWERCYSGSRIHMLRTSLGSKGLLFAHIHLPEKASLQLGLSLMQPETFFIPQIIYG